MSSRSLLSGRTHDSASMSTIPEASLLVLLEGSAEEASKACEALRRSLSHTPCTLDTGAVAEAVLHVLERYSGQLRVSHLCVAVLAHPTLNAAPHAFEPSVLRALERLSLSAAFVHTALAALQNAASADAKVARDTVLNTVVSSMRQHPTHTGILLRAADLVAFHLNQPVAPPSASTFDLCANAVVGAAPRLYASPQGASAGLLALVACARYAQTSSSRRSSTHHVIDTAFASVVVQAMGRHRDFAPVQVLSAELVRVASAGSGNAARMAARDFFANGALKELLVAIHTHVNDDTVVERCLAALRSLLLLGDSGAHARTPKPTVNLTQQVADAVVAVVDKASSVMRIRNADVAALAATLLSDLKSAAAASASSSSLSASSTANNAGTHGRPPSQGGVGAAKDGGSSRSFSMMAFGRRFARSLRMGSRGVQPRKHSDGPPSNGSRYQRMDKPYASGQVAAPQPMSGASNSGLVYSNSVNLASLDRNNDSASASIKLYSRAPPAGASGSFISNRSAASSGGDSPRWRNFDSPPASASGQRWSPPASAQAAAQRINDRRRPVQGRWYSPRNRQRTPSASASRPVRVLPTSSTPAATADVSQLSRKSSAVGLDQVSRPQTVIT